VGDFSIRFTSVVMSLRSTSWTFLEPKAGVDLILVALPHARLVAQLGVVFDEPDAQIFDRECLACLALVVAGVAAAPHLG